MKGLIVYQHQSTLHSITNIIRSYSQADSVIINSKLMVITTDKGRIGGVVEDEIYFLRMPSDKRMQYANTLKLRDRQFEDITYFDGTGDEDFLEDKTYHYLNTKLA